MKILLTGGAGFIGTNFVNLALEQGHEIVVLDKLTYAGHKDQLPLDKITFVKGDICDYKLVKKLLKTYTPDVVINMAAESHVDRSLAGLDSAIEFMRTNSEGVLILAQACLEEDIYLHQVSTDEVFGDLPDLATPAFNEQSAYKPSSPYAVSKASGDLILMAMGRSFPNLKYSISYCTNNYGPYQSPEKLIPRALALVAEGKKIPLYSRGGLVGENYRDWLYVTDHCQAILQIVQNKSFGKRYCVSYGGLPVSNLDLVHAILDELQMTPFYNFIESVGDRPGHDFRYALNSSLIRMELGWASEVFLSEGLKKTVDWYTSDQGVDWLTKHAKEARDVRKGQSKRAKK